MSCSPIPKLSVTASLPPSMSLPMLPEMYKDDSSTVELESATVDNSTTYPYSKPVSVLFEKVNLISLSEFPIEVPLLAVISESTLL